MKRAGGGDSLDVWGGDESGSDVCCFVMFVPVTGVM